MQVNDKTHADDWNTDANDASLTMFSQKLNTNMHGATIISIFTRSSCDADTLKRCSKLQELTTNNPWHSESKRVTDYNTFFTEEK